MQVWEKVQLLRKGFNKLGITKKEHVAIVAETRAEWLHFDIASLVCFPLVTMPDSSSLPQVSGLVTVPVQHSLDEPTMRYIIGQCGASLVVCSGAAAPMVCVH